jgi:predicted AAA+ superfamily ATPase
MKWEEIESQNPWWEDPEEIEKDEKVAEALAKKHRFLPPYESGNWLLLGPRQTGKTTYLKLCIRDLVKNHGIDPTRCLYFVCNLTMNPQDIIDIIRLFAKIPGRKYVFFDEISFVPKWERAVKHILDVPALRTNMSFYFTGSTTLELQKERFPGRPIKIREWLPLTFRNFCKVFGSQRLVRSLNDVHTNRLEEITELFPNLLAHRKELTELFDSYLRCGGFLRSAYELVEGGRITEETIDTYWNWIAGDITRLDLSERTLSAILKGIVRMYSSSFSLSSLAKEMEIPSHITVRDYLELLERLYVLRSYWKGYTKTPAFRKERKVYFTDPFLYRVATFKTTGFRDEIPSEQPKIVEGIVGETLRRIGFDVRFLRNHREIDFVAKDVGIEIKWQEHVTAKDFPISELKHKILLSKNDAKLDDVTIIPVPLFLAILGN